MHACGHDGHMAMLLVASKVLTEMRDEIKGNIKLVFQPNEEDAGAYKMIDEGVMENPKVDFIFGSQPLFFPYDQGEGRTCRFCP
jgi:metal-dependent amidase/aminoacylase/carboxypeptidase family protein